MSAWMVQMNVLTGWKKFIYEKRILNLSSVMLPWQKNYKQRIPLVLNFPELQIIIVPSTFIWVEETNYSQVTVSDSIGKTSFDHCFQDVTGWLSVWLCCQDQDMELLTLQSKSDGGFVGRFLYISLKWIIPLGVGLSIE